METMFYDELEPNNESPTPGTPRVPILEEKKGGGTHDLRNLLERKKAKEGAQHFRMPGMCSSARTQRKANLSFMKVRRA